MVRRRSQEVPYKGKNSVARVKAQDYTTSSEDEERQRFCGAATEVKQETCQSPVKKKAAAPRRTGRGIRRKGKWSNQKRSGDPKAEKKQPRQPPKQRQVPEFFKVFIPEINSEQLRIPLAFLNKHKRLIKEMVFLKGPSGEMSFVDVRRTRDAVYLAQGWPEFIRDHEIKVGEVVVFTYMGYHTFSVKIFGTDGCGRNEEPTPAVSADDKDVNDEPDDDEETDEPMASDDDYEPVEQEEEDDDDDDPLMQKQSPPNGSTMHLNRCISHLQTNQSKTWGRGSLWFKDLVPVSGSDGRQMGH